MALAASVSLSFAATEARAATITTLFNTGVDASGVALGNNVDDPHYVISSAPSGSLVDRTVTSADGFPIPHGWATLRHQHGSGLTIQETMTRLVIIFLKQPSI